MRRLVFSSEVLISKNILVHKKSVSGEKSPGKFSALIEANKDNLRGNGDIPYERWVDGKFKVPCKRQTQITEFHL